MQVAFGLAAVCGRLVPRVDEPRALTQRVAAERLELKRPGRAHRKSRPHMHATGWCEFGSLGELDPVRAGALLARLDLEADALAAGERVEVHARVETGPVEEILLSIFGRDEAEPAIGDQLLNGPCRHPNLLFSKACPRTPGPFREDHDRGEHRPTTGDRSYLTTAPWGWRRVR